MRMQPSMHTTRVLLPCRVCMQGGMRRLDYAPGTWGYCPDEALPLIQQRWMAKLAQRRWMPAAPAVPAAIWRGAPQAQAMLTGRGMAVGVKPAHGKGAPALAGAQGKAVSSSAVGMQRKAAQAALPIARQRKVAAPAWALGAQRNTQGTPAPQPLELSAAYDVYGLGVTMLEVLSGVRMSKMKEGGDRVLMPQPLVDFRNGQVDAVRKAIQKRYPTTTDAQMDGILELCKQCVEACREDRCTAMQAYKQLLVLMQ